MTLTIHPSIFAAIVVLATSAAVTGDPHDYELTLHPSGEKVCTTGRDVCEMAVRALRDRSQRRWTPVGEGTTDGSCAPRPGCRDARSLCIDGYNCR